MRSFPRSGSVCSEILCLEIGYFGAWEGLREKKIGLRMNTNSHELSLDFADYNGRDYGRLVTVALRLPCLS